MKTRATIIAALAAITTAWSTTINWEESSEAVNIGASGTGFGSQTFDSPSGSWEFSLKNFGYFDEPSSTFSFNVHGILTFLGDLPSDIYYPVIDDRDHYMEVGKKGHFLVTGTGCSGFYSDTRDPWRGTIAMQITETPILDDPSTWSWVTSYRVSGPSLAVPDSGSTGLCLAFAAGLLLFFRPRKEKAWTS